MYCKKCGEENPEHAVYCRNCGTKLAEEVKKTTVIETEGSNQNTQTKTNNNSSKDDSNWIGCCLCLIAIFIVFAVIGSFQIIV